MNAGIIASGVAGLTDSDAILTAAAMPRAA